jgi:DNA-binding CsgD family transcriptional regulator
MRHIRSFLCGRSQFEALRAVAASLDWYAVPAFLTDPWNRITWVNQPFARLVGDHIQDRIPADLRFVAAAMLGPYADHFPRRRQEIAACLSGLDQEIASGALAPETCRLVAATLELDAVVRRSVEGAAPWDGTVVIRGDDGAMTQFRETVLPVLPAAGQPGGFHVSVWTPVEPARHPQATSGLAGTGDTRGLADLTPRQQQLARWYAAGLTSRQVAERAGVTHRTARDHLEAIYDRLGIHSRAELAACVLVGACLDG